MIEDSEKKIDLIGQERAAFSAQLTAYQIPSFRARQLWHWIYHRGVRDFSAMTSLAKSFRAELAEKFIVSRPEITQTLASKDGTHKWLLRFADKVLVETVHIPETDRGTLCLSSQVGCTLNCRFCHTGTQVLVRNLNVAEIVGQVMCAKDELDDWPKIVDGKRAATRLLSNIVMMGMGEPLYNFDAVAQALKIVTDPEGIALSRRRITISTAGVVPMMQRCGLELGVNLAISLHAVTDAIRDEIVPINRKYPIAELLQACRNYPGANNARRITFEYVMLRDVNDSLADARGLVALLRDIPAKVNLIPFNPWPGAPYQRSRPDVIRRFAEIVMAAGYASPIRTPRGTDIMAACGQLKSDSIKLRRGSPLQAA